MKLDTERINYLAKFFSNQKYGTQATIGTFKSTIESLLLLIEFESLTTDSNLTRSDEYLKAKEVLEAYKLCSGD
jgi:hypothetical protein